MSKSVLVSICCTTYNHENYISQCLDGFLSQKTNFKFEILVHDDASTDRTPDIVREYEKSHPKLFRNIYQKENQFLIQNTLTNILYPMAKGKYIALCEGDDYWTDPYKLQKQVDFLEKNPDYSACAHTSTCIYMTNKEEKVKNHITSQFEENNKILFDKDIESYDLFSTYPFQTATFLFRREKYEKKKHLANILNQGDLNLYILMRSMGKIRKFKKPMAIWRIHPMGESKTWDDPEKKINSVSNIKSLKNAKYLISGLIKLRNLFKDNRNEINLGISNRIHQYIDQSVTEKNFKYYFFFALFYLKVNRINQIRFYWLIGSFKKVIF